MSNLAKYFFKGLLFCVPMAVTVLVVSWMFQWLYGFAAPFTGAETPFWMKPLLTIGVLVVMVSVIIIAGWAATNYFGRQALAWIDAVLGKLPGFKMIYTSVKDITEAFGGEKKKFDKPVLVRPVANGPQMVGFVTSENLEFAGMADKISVYLPLSYNFCGIMVIVPRSQVETLNLDSKDAMTFVVSGGIVKGDKEE
jgi:uncharacterized membrane protein